MQGVEQFRRALEISPANISVHFGLSSALLGLSKECINLGAFSWAASLLEVSSMALDVIPVPLHPFIFKPFLIKMIILLRL